MLETIKNFTMQFWFYVLLILIILFTIIRVKIRGFFWKDKFGNELSLREFFKQWGKGIEGITQKQKEITNLMGTWIVITGIIAGIIVNALIRMENQWWWIEVILVGSLILTVIQLIGTYQRFKTLKLVEIAMKEAESNMEESHE